MTNAEYLARQLRNRLLKAKVGMENIIYRRGRSTYNLGILEGLRMAEIYVDEVFGEDEDATPG